MKNKKKSFREIETELEKQNKFDVDYLPQCKRYITPDADFVFVKKNIFYKISCATCRTITFLLGPILCAALGLRVRGKQNLKSLRKQGAICVCNHVGYLDTLYVKMAVGHYRSYHTGAPWNNRKGFGGFVLRRAGFLSLGGTIAAQRNFRKTVGELLEKGAVINYYPEHAMWQRYEKPRPLKSGAFKTAANFGVPVLPLFVTFKGRHKRPVINILPPIYPKEGLAQRAAAADMQERCASAWKDIYEKTYRKKLVYLKDEETPPQQLATADVGEVRISKIVVDKSAVAALNNADDLSEGFDNADGVTTAEEPIHLTT